MTRSRTSWQSLRSSRSRSCSPQRRRIRYRTTPSTRPARRLKALAISSKQRSAQLPNVPTLDELGVKGYEAATFTGIFAPAGVPPAVAEKLHGALKTAMSNQAVRERYRSMGVEIMDMNQAEFAAYVRADFEKWQQVAREANIVIE